MPQTINTCYFLLLCWLSSIPGIAQFAQLAFRHYTPDEGLPSSECYDLVQDEEGYVWISTDNGVSRFNSYEFENFGPEEGLKNNVVLYLQEDHQGRIWMVTLSSNIYIYNKDMIQAFPYNHILQKKKKTARITDFYVDSNEVFHAALYDQGFIKIQKNGAYEMIGDTLSCIDRIPPDPLIRASAYPPIRTSPTSQRPSRLGVLACTTLVPSAHQNSS